jgi:hypothetical protein
MRRTWIAPAVLGIALSVAAPAGAAAPPTEATREFEELGQADN